MSSMPATVDEWNRFLRIQKDILKHLDEKIKELENAYESQIESLKKKLIKK